MSGFRLYFAGAEQPAWRKLLHECGVQNMAISYSNLRPRLPKHKPYLISEKAEFEDSQILVDSGGYACNQKGWNEAQHRDYFAQFAEFVVNNLDRIHLVTEYDVIQFPDLVTEWRNDFWTNIPQDKFVPVWHAEYSPAELANLAASFPNLAIVGGSRVSSRLRSLVATHGLNLHATRTKPEDLYRLPYSSASSSSWVSPMKYGETHIWDGKRLRRYPEPYKERRRKDHRIDFERAGFDPDKILADDPDEVARLSVWSWLQLEADLSDKKGGEPPDEGDSSNIVSITSQRQHRSRGRSGGTGVDKTPNSGVGQDLVKRNDHVTLPIMDVETREVANPEGEGTIDISVPVVAKTPIRQCSTCQLKDVCPEFQDGSTCAFNIPVAIRSRDELLGALTFIMESQLHRVAMGRFGEELEGGLIDQNLSAEMDRFFRMTKMRKEIEEQGFSINIKGTNAGPGVLTKLFSPEVGDKAKELDRPLDEAETDALIGEFIDAEEVRDDDE